jgi:hypothetical protein
MVPDVSEELVASNFRVVKVSGIESKSVIYGQMIGIAILSGVRVKHYVKL